MKIHVNTNGDSKFWIFAALLWCILAIPFALIVFAIALPFSIICMTIVSDSPFWMWQIIFMFFAGVMLSGKK